VLNLKKRAPTEADQAARSPLEAEAHSAPLTA